MEFKTSETFECLCPSDEYCKGETLQGNSQYSIAHLASDPSYNSSEGFVNYRPNTRDCVDQYMSSSAGMGGESLIIRPSISSYTQNGSSPTEQITVEQKSDRNRHSPKLPLGDDPSKSMVSPHACFFQVTPPLQQQPAQKQSRKKSAFLGLPKSGFNSRTDLSPRRVSVLNFIGQGFTKSVIEDPSTHFCLRLCCRGWLGVLRLLIALRAILVRFVFLGLTFTSIVTVVKTKVDNWYWLLCLLVLPLLADLCFSIWSVIVQQGNRNCIDKWFTKCLLAYLLCACPPIWIIELHHLRQLNDATEAVIQQASRIIAVTPNPWIDSGLEYNAPNENLIIMGSTVEDFLNELVKPRINETKEGKLGIVRRVRRQVESEDEIRTHMPTAHEGLIQAVTLQHYPLKLRIRIMEQLLLLSVIVGRWLLPRFGISRDQLSQLLLINIGNAADILELFEAFNEEAVRSNHYLKICILCLWQASLLQFCFNKTATMESKTTLPRSMSPSSTMNDLRMVQSRRFSQLNTLDSSFLVKSRSQPVINFTPGHLTGELTETTKRSNGLCGCYCCCRRQQQSKSQQQQQQGFMTQEHIEKGPNACVRVCFGTELWAICMSLLLQDVPFLCLRLSLVLNFNWISPQIKIYKSDMPVPIFCQDVRRMFMSLSGRRFEQ